MENAVKDTVEFDEEEQPVQTVKEVKTMKTQIELVTAEVSETEKRSNKGDID